MRRLLIALANCALLCVALAMPGGSAQAASPIARLYDPAAERADFGFGGGETAWVRFRAEEDIEFTGVQTLLVPGEPPSNLHPSTTSNFTWQLLKTDEGWNAVNGNHDRVFTSYEFVPIDDRSGVYTTRLDDGQDHYFCGDTSYPSPCPSAFHLEAGNYYTLSLQVQGPLAWRLPKFVKPEGPQATADGRLTVFGQHYFPVLSSFVPAFSFVVAEPGVVPEPSTWVLLIGGFGTIGAMLRRRRELVQG